MEKFNNSKNDFIVVYGPQKKETVKELFDNGYGKAAEEKDAKRFSTEEEAKEHIQWLFTFKEQWVEYRNPPIIRKVPRLLN